MNTQNLLSRPPIPEEVLNAVRSQQKNSFQVEIEALRDSIGVDHHSQFVKQILSRYEWDSESRHEIQARLDEIVQRQNEPRLFIGVIGEFSTGKSTLINALIREELLKTDVLQATTSAATLLSYGAKVDAEVRFKDGNLKTYFKEGKKPVQEAKDIWKFIHACSADEKTAKDVVQVNVYHPLPVFQQGLVIVDTPGTNVENPRHIQVTQQAIREICDAAIVIIPADIPVSQTLQQFLKAHLSDVLHRCIFVVTRIDLIRERERSRLIKSIQAILKRELKLSSPQVLEAAAQLFLDDLLGVEEYQNESRGAFVEQFQQTEKSIYRRLQANKTLIILERLTVFFSALFNQLDGKLRERSEKYRQKHEILKRNRIPNLAEFVEKQKQKHTREFRSEIYDIVNRVPHIVIYRHQKQVEKHLKKDIEAATSKEKLNTILKSKPKQRMVKVQSKINDDLVELRRHIQKAAEKQHREFKAEFTKLYQSLATLEGSLESNSRALTQSVDLSNPPQNFGVSGGVDKAIADENANIWVGAGAGLLFTIFSGGIGILPILIGMGASFFFGPSLDQVKQKALDELLPSMEDIFVKFEKAATQELEKIVNQKAEALEDIIEGYFEVYGRKVNEMIARDEAEKAQLVKDQQMIEMDLKQIRTRLNSLEQVREKLRKYSYG